MESTDEQSATFLQVIAQNLAQQSDIIDLESSQYQRVNVQEDKLRVSFESVDDDLKESSSGQKDESGSHYSEEIEDESKKDDIEESLVQSDED